MDPTVNYNPFLTGDVQKWLDTIETYVKETDDSLLNLRCKCHKYYQFAGSVNDTTLNMPFEVVESILERLANSQVTELRLDFADFSQKFPKGVYDQSRCENSFCELVKNTKIKKLDVGDPRLLVPDLVALLDIIEQSNVEDCGEFVFVGRTTEGRKLAPRLVRSRLTKLNVKFFGPQENSSVFSFADGLPESSLTSLRLTFIQTRKMSSSTVQKIWTSLFSKLPHCQIKELDLSGTEISFDVINILSQNLAASKLEVLNLSRCKITDTCLDILAQGLVGSKVSNLDLSGNHIRGLNNFGHYVNRTNIVVLNLSNNGIEERQMFASPNLFIGSLVESLDIRNNYFNQAFGIELLKSLKFTKVTELNLSCSSADDLDLAEFVVALFEASVAHVKLDLPESAINVFGEALKESKVECIKFQNNEAGSSELVYSLNLVESSTISSLELKLYDFSPDIVKHLESIFVVMYLTQLHLADSALNGLIATCAPYLTDTSVACLSFQRCALQDEDVLILAQILKRTKVYELNLSENKITSVGAEAFTVHFPETNVISLNLHHNEINDDGLEILARGFSNLFLTALDVSNNPGRKYIPIQTMLFENRLRAHKLVAFFQQIVPEISKGNFCFSRLTTDTSVNDFLQACLTFYKTVVEQPAAISILIKDENIPFSREELVSQFDKFPLQFSQFIGNEIEADVRQHVELLEKAEELGLNKIVELLLLNRPLYYIDEIKEILHPRVYALLLKYKLPVVNTGIEPAGIERIVDYFTQHTYIEGSADLINLLSSIETS